MAPTAHPSLRQRHQDRTRSAILDAATDLFTERGFAATTVDDIAERADVAPRTFFRYFPTKEAVLFHDRDQKLARMLERIEARPEGEAPHDSLVAVLSDLGDELAADPTRACLIARLVREHPPLLVQQQVAMLAQYEDEIVRVLARRAGTDPDQDLKLRAVTGAVLSCVSAAFRWWLATDPEAPFSPVLGEALTACDEAFGAGAAVAAAQTRIPPLAQTLKPPPAQTLKPPLASSR